MAYKLTIDGGGYWCLAAENDPIFYLRVELSKSGRAKCRACGEFIKSKTVRIGKPVKWRGFISSWMHPACFWRSKEDMYLPESGEISEENIHGFFKLNSEAQQLIKISIVRTKPPKHLVMDEEDKIDDGAFSAIKKYKIKSMKQPDTLAVNLLPFQEEGLGWMVAQEISHVHGGILADEMGMGKTIQTISLLLTQKKLSGTKQGPTLVVCPASAMLQWQEEIKRCTSSNSLKVFVFHGDLRSYISPKELNSVDVVLTTFPTLEYAYRTSANAQKVPCKYCSKKFLYPKLVLHNKYFCGPYSKRSQRLSKTDRNEKQKEATKKAMVTLKITKSSVPTPANIYRELMQSANRVPVSMYTNKKKAAEIERNSKRLNSVEEESFKKVVIKQIEPERRLWSGKVRGTKNIICFARREITKTEGRRLNVAVNESIYLSNIAFPVKRNKIAFGSFKASYNPSEEEDTIFFRPTTTSFLSKQKVQLRNICLRLLKSEVLEISRNDGKTWTELAKGCWLGAPGEYSRKTKIGTLVIVDNGDKPFVRIGLVSDIIKNGRKREVIVNDIYGETYNITRSELQKCSTRTVVVSYFDHIREVEELNTLLAPVKKQSKTSKKVSIKTGKKSLKTKPIPKKPINDSDSEYIESSESDSDSSFVADSGSETETEEEEHVETDFAGCKFVVPVASFVPATWGPKDKSFDDLVNYQKRKRGTFKRKTKKQRNKKKKGKSKKRKLNKNSDEEDSVFKGEYAVDSSSEEDISDYQEEEELRKPTEPFRYAPQGDVVDEDGVDLGYSLLHSIAWERVILDEAHKIKDRTNSTAKSTFALRGMDEVTSQVDYKSPCKRWCLTGTPLQNRVGEIYALIRFLRMDPFAYYRCSTKNCDCKQLNWRFGPENRKCRDCGCPPLKHFSYFNKHIMNPIKRSGFSGPGKRAMKVLRLELLEKTMLRRTKVERVKDLNLPNLDISTVKLKMSAAEKDFYESVYKNTRSKFDTFVKRGTLLHNYAHIFELLSRLRRSADHPYLVVHGSNSTLQIVDKPQKPNGETEDYELGEINTKSAGASDVCGICNLDIEDLKDCALSYCRHTFHKGCVKKFSLENLKKKIVSECPVCFQPLKVNFGFKDGRHTGEEPVSMYTEDDAVCVICFENKRDALILPCGHLFTCLPCVKGLRSKQCPMCREPIKKIVKSESTETKDRNSIYANAKTKGRTKNLLGRKSILQKISLDNFQSSTKINAVITEVKKMKAIRLERGEKPHKAIIFSQYSDMIDLVEWKLRISGIKPVKLIGSMPVRERQAVLKAFRESDDVVVILMSLKAGGEGLNLQVASHVFILETWWNPQVHNQAYQRAHRIGQTRDVKAVLFVTEETIEDRMHELQQKKELVFKGAVDGSSKAMQQLTEEDLRFLFTR